MYINFVDKVALLSVYENHSKIMIASTRQEAKRKEIPTYESWHYYSQSRTKVESDSYTNRLSKEYPAQGNW